MKILVVDDNLMNQKVMRALLSRDKHECDVLSEGKQAIEAVKRENYAVILMDVMMPEMDGIVASAEIRKFNTTIPIITVSALDPSDYKERALDAGINDFIAKPIDPEILRKKLKQWLPG